MGYIAHDVAVAVISDYDKDTLRKVEEWRASLDEWWQQFVLGPVEGVNGYTTFVFAPDGSKEGWGPSDEGDRLREQFVDLANGGR